MSWCQTYTGRQVWPLDPDGTPLSAISLEDIAHSLSMICRFNGHCEHFYSVAEHSIIIADEVFSQTSDPFLALEALFHDASEAYVGDIVAPIKPNYIKKVEKKWAAKIAKKFKFSLSENPLIKLLDMRILITEGKELMAPPPASWGYDDIEPLNVNLDLLLPKPAKKLFIQKYFFYKNIIAMEINEKEGH